MKNIMEVSFKNMSLLVIMAILQGYVVKAGTYCGGSYCSGSQSCCDDDGMPSCCTDVSNSWWFWLLIAVLIIVALIAICLRMRQCLARIQSNQQEYDVIINATVDVTHVVPPPPAYGTVNPNHRPNPDYNMKKPQSNK